jgi:tight adherence protein C
VLVMPELMPLIVGTLSFGAVAAIVFVAGQYLLGQAQMQRRLPLPARASEGSAGGPPSVLQAFIARHFDDKHFGVDSTLRGKLRRELLRAGYFRSDALSYYLFARIAVAIAFPVGAYVLLEVFLRGAPWYLKLALVGGSIALGIIGPDIYLDRRQKRLAQHYRQLFPDFLDLLVVCIDAGLGLEGALNRITTEIAKHSRQLGLNLLMIDAEMRAGRSTMDALGSFADRVPLDEARSLVVVLRQSLELGSDVADTLRVFSDEMRDKRVLRAEENANMLPVKMTAPLGLFIFPVVLLVVLFPVGLRLAKMMAAG